MTLNGDIQLEACAAQGDNIHSEVLVLWRTRKMDSLELYNILHRQPFQPFRVFVRDGRVYDIRYPRLSVVGTWYFAIGIPLAGQPDPPFYVDHTDFIDLTWIDRIEMLDAVPASAQP